MIRVNETQEDDYRGFAEMEGLVLPCLTDLQWPTFADGFCWANEDPDLPWLTDASLLRWPGWRSLETFRGFGDESWQPMPSSWPTFALEDQAE